MSAVILNDWGKSNWTNYVDYWRDNDAEYLQARTILRYHTMGDAATDNPTPLTGQVVYNELDDMLYFRSKGPPTAWKRYAPLPFNMNVPLDAATGVTLQHSSAPGGMIFTSPTGSPASVVLAQVPLHAVGSTTILDSTGITLKTGPKTIKLNTNATQLVCDSPISATSLVGGVLTANTSLTVNGPATVTGLLTAQGLSVTSSLAAAIGSNIGGVTFGDQSVNVAKGIQSVGGVLFGTASSIRIGAGTLAAPSAGYVDVTASEVKLSANTINFDGAAFITARAINYKNAAGNVTKPIAPSFYDGGSPNPADFPDGTIWVV